MNKGFTIKCNNCGVEIQINDKDDLYKFWHEIISIVVSDDGSHLFFECEECKNEVELKW